jgi:hypothetical protein
MRPEAKKGVIVSGNKPLLRASSLEALKRQRSHVLFLLNDAAPGQEANFEHWYAGAFRDAVRGISGLLSARHYKQHEIDITKGRLPRAPSQYLGLYELSIDGAEAAAEPIETIAQLYQAQPAAQAPATWLYYPVSEKVGASQTKAPLMLTVAFANGLVGQEAEFREWYITRHLRHALNISALVSGQCFERAQFQRPGAAEARFAMIAVYEQVGSAEEFLESYSALPPGTLHFPMLDRERFAESLFRPLED